MNSKEYFGVGVANQGAVSTLSAVLVYTNNPYSNLEEMGILDRVTRKRALGKLSIQGIVPLKG